MSSGYLAKKVAATQPSTATTAIAPFDVSDAANDEVFDPSKVNKETLDDMGLKLSNLIAATEELANKSKQKADAPPPPKATIESLRARLDEAEAIDRKRAAQLVDLTAVPNADQATVTIFTECDELMVSGDVESALVGAETAAAGYADAESRLAALQALRMPIDDAMSKLAAAGVTMRDDFVEFAEMCAVKRVRLCCLSRGLKPLLRQLLRDQGLGHVEVLANEMFIERAKEHAWNVSWRDHSTTGHDKAETLRRALQTGAKGGGKSKVVLVGQTACDFAPIKAGQVDCLFAPVGSKLATLASDAGIQHCTFTGWAELQKSVLGF